MNKTHAQRLATSLRPLAAELLAKPMPEELDRKKIGRAAEEWIDFLEEYQEDPKKELKHKKTIREWILRQLDVDWAADMDDASLKDAARIIQKRLFTTREREAFARCQSREILHYLEAIDKDDWKELLKGKNSLKNIIKHFEKEDDEWQEALLSHSEFALGLLEKVWGSREFGLFIEKHLVVVLQAQLDGSPTAIPLEKAVAKVWEHTKVEKCLIHAFPALLLGDLLVKGVRDALGNDQIKSPVEAIRNLLVQVIRKGLKEANEKELKRWIKALKV